MHKPRLRRHRETHLLVWRKPVSTPERDDDRGGDLRHVFAGSESTSFPPTLTELIMLPPRPGKALESPHGSTHRTLPMFVTTCCR